VYESLTSAPGVIDVQVEVMLASIVTAAQAYCSGVSENSFLAELDEEMDFGDDS